jgi:AbrB family looped-hinge helix DNA binding protein
MRIARVTVKGQVVIPAPIRKKYHVTQGTMVGIEDAGGVILIRPLLRDPVKEARGMFKGGKSALRVLLSDRETEARK